MSSGYPWSVLCIGPTDDVGEIRRAYARRLRVVRPDENAAAFQELVQARDLALKLASQSRPARTINTVRFELERPGAAVTTVNVSFEEVASPPPPPPPSAPPEPGPQPGPEACPRDKTGEPPKLETRPPQTPAPEPEQKAKPERERQAEPEQQAQPHPPPPRPRAPAPMLRAPAAPTASPQSVVEAAQRMFSSPRLDGWSDVVKRLGELSQAGRAVTEGPILRLAAQYARQNRADLMKMRGSARAFFALLAALNSEFGWRERDRIVYNTLNDAVEADGFVALLDRAYRQPQKEPELIQAPAYHGIDSDGEGLSPNQRRDRYHFFDQNNDVHGLSVCRKLLADPNFRHRWDAFGLLFAPRRPQSLKAAPLLLIAFLGWLTLLLLWIPHLYWLFPMPVTYLLLRDVHLSEPPRRKIWATVHKAAWLITQTTYAIWFAGVLAAISLTSPPDWLEWLYAPFFVVYAYCAYAIGRLLAGTTRKGREEHPAWDRKALLLFPLFAMTRGYFPHAAAGFMAWTALLVHEAPASLQFPWTGHANFGHLVLILLVLTMHITAGYSSGQWLVHRFFSVVRKADRRQMFDPELRAAFLLERGTRKKNQKREQSGGSRSSWWWILLVVWIVGHLVKAMAPK